LANKNGALTIDGQTPAGVQDMYLAKIDKATGATVWLRFLGFQIGYQSIPTYDSAEDAIYLTAVSDGTLPGETNRGGRDILTVKFDKDGNRLWHDQWGHPDGWSMFG
jgi:hypothetical protein